MPILQSKCVHPGVYICRSLFYSKLLKKSGEKEKTDIEEQLGSYVALDPAQRESIAVKQKVSYLLSILPEKSNS